MKLPPMMDLWPITHSSKAPHQPYNEDGTLNNGCGVFGVNLCMKENTALTFIP